MKTRININYQVLYRSVVLSLAACAALFGGLYLLYSVLSLVFVSPQVFASLFGICVSLGVLITYDADGFQWDNNPRIAIRWLRTGNKGGEDV
jgi:hypothetical protein